MEAACAIYPDLVLCPAEIRAARWQPLRAVSYCEPCISEWQDGAHQWGFVSKEKDRRGARFKFHLCHKRGTVANVISQGWLAKNNEVGGNIKCRDTIRSMRAARCTLQNKQDDIKAKMPLGEDQKYI